MEWKFNNPKFEYENSFEDLGWPWFSHRYFGYDLVINTNPKLVVELGTHYGTSFWSFSQAVKDYNLKTNLFAVDTWEGEKHAGYYNEDVFLKVNEIKNKYYKNLNINLLRKTFDEALEKFSDESIDILHIDGLHTYEAVRHDFENWLPKIKKNGIIMFHDISVKRGDFGVFKLWGELKTKYQTIEFPYSYGLGILFLDKEDEILKIRDSLLSRYTYFVEDMKNRKIREKLEELKIALRFSKELRMKSYFNEIKIRFLKPIIKYFYAKR